MGKRYYCDYCDKTMPCTPSIIKTHNSGLVHQKLVQEHYQSYKDPEQIFSEESVKKPCNRFASGHCQFGIICRYSHYTREQIEYLKQYVSSKKQSEDNPNTPCFQRLYTKLQEEKSTKTQQVTDGTVLIDTNGVTHELPWNYNNEYEKYDLPPSVRRITTDNFVDVKFAEWG